MYRKKSYLYAAKTKINMKERFISLLFSCLFACLPISLFADSPIEDGVYYISCTLRDGYVALGANHGVDAFIYYVTDGGERTADGYWIVTNTPSGYTFRNEATNELLIFTYGRDDQYYKYMTLASESLGDNSEYWNIIEGTDGAYSIQSIVDTDYYWNLRTNNMLGTYRGSQGTGGNERYVFTKKSDSPGPGPGPGPDPELPADEYSPITFPEALHVYLSDGRVEAYPLDIIASQTEQDGQLIITTAFGQDYTYDLSEVDSVSGQRPEFPNFVTFKFAKKNNDQLFAAANGEIVGDTVFVSIGAIGKRLTPTFDLFDEGDKVYVNGKLQDEMGDRLRFDKDIYYLVAPSVYQILLSDGNGQYAMHPYGRCVRVHVDWLTDRAEVPTIYIDTEDGLPITSKDYFKNATITIDGHDIFPSMEATPVQIKGRGNSSWGWPKKPYRLKFAEKLKPLGMTKGKSWVLLSNYQTGSLMSNAIGMKAANLMGSAGANHIVPVDLYLNGEYRGSYNFTEKVGFSNNSIDLIDESRAAMLELDSYYDEPDEQKFRSKPYNLPVNIKEPDFSEGLTELTLETIEQSFNSFVSALYYGEDISPYVNIEQLVRFMMVNELTLNYEFYHPKSTFCYREDFMDDSCKYIFGPTWDLDWCFGYENSKNYFKNESTSNYWIDMPSFSAVDFVRDLRFKYEPLGVLYRQLWEEFMENDLQELLEYAQDYYDFAHNSFEQNRYVWGDYTDYAAQVQQASNWLNVRTQKIYQDILDDVRPYIPGPVEPVEFANNKLYTISCPRGDLILSYDHSGLEAGQSAWWNVQDYEKQFAIITIDGLQYLYSPYLNKYLKTGDVLAGEWVDYLGSPIYFDPFSPLNDYYIYMITTRTEYGSTLWFNNNSTTIVINNFSKPDDGNRWSITEAGDFDPTEALALANQSLYAVTNRYIWNDEVIASETFQLPSGANLPEPSSQYMNSFVSLSIYDEIPLQVEGDMTIDYQVEWYGPFEFTTSPENAYWYNMTIRGSYYVGRQDTEPYYPSVVDEETLMHDGNYYWAFGGNPYHVKLYNYSTGFSQTLTYDSGNAVMRPGEYLWDLIPNLQYNGFVLRKPGTDNTCINQLGSTSGPLSLWKNDKSLTDFGSTFRIVEADPSGMAATLAQTGGATYNLAGQRVGEHFKGIVIRNGKKVLIK